MTNTKESQRAYYKGYNDGLRVSKSELFKGITRIEIIEGSERKFVKWNCKIEPSFQDNNRTLKIFVEAI